MLDAQTKCQIPPFQLGLSLPITKSFSWLGSSKHTNCWTHLRISVSQLLLMKVLFSFGFISICSIYCTQRLKEREGRSRMAKSLIVLKTLVTSIFPSAIHRPFYPLIIIDIHCPSKLKTFKVRATCTDLSESWIKSCQTST